MVFTFSEDIKAIDGTPDETEVSLLCSQENGYSSCGTKEAVEITGNMMTVNISGIPDVRCLWVKVNGIADLEDNPLVGDNDVYIVVLAGDVNDDGNTNLIDMAAVKAKNGSDPTAPGMSKYDVNLDGQINLIDMAAVKGKNGGSAVCP